MGTPRQLEPIPQRSAVTGAEPNATVQFPTRRLCPSSITPPSANLTALTCAGKLLASRRPHDGVWSATVHPASASVSIAVISSANVVFRIDVTPGMRSPRCFVNDEVFVGVESHYLRVGAQLFSFVPLTHNRKNGARLGNDLIATVDLVLCACLNLKLRR